ncbi:MAG: hypothetical protein KGZ92_07320 [Firmicutes bacterium]|nr:hypothetical protein [Dethiobacter sp.]MBS3889084.1 hypothetical protein [Bacillota bacterium]MBS4054684.1 hypothetical protein [Thermaerobacter sp.]
MKILEYGRDLLALKQVTITAGCCSSSLCDFYGVHSPIAEEDVQEENKT